MATTRKRKEFQMKSERLKSHWNSFFLLDINFFFSKNDSLFIEGTGVGLQRIGYHQLLIFSLQLSYAVRLVHRLGILKFPPLAVHTCGHAENFLLKRNPEWFGYIFILKNKKKGQEIRWVMKFWHKKMRGGNEISAPICCFLWLFGLRSSSEGSSGQK